MSQNMQKERYSSAHPLLSSGLGVNEFNTINTNIQDKIDLGTNGIIKLERYFIKYTLYSLNTLPVPYQQAWL